MVFDTAAFLFQAGSERHPWLFSEKIVMSRFKRVIHNAASGYGLLVATALYVFASVPLALRFLSKEQFALWALMTSVTNYLSLIDLGMSVSLARLLIDHKDERDNGNYGSLIRTGALVLTVQGAIIFTVGFAFAPLFCNWLVSEPELQRSFIALVRWQSGILAFGLAFRVFSHLLYAHQRLDIANYCQMGMTTLNFFALWFFFRHQQGVFSLIWANLIGALGTAAIAFVVCWRLHLLPTSRQWGKASWQQFKMVFDYGKDIFLVALGTQLIMTSQIMIITRTLGLGAAAAWTVGTKMFTFISQAIWRISDASMPAFSEMIARNEQGILRERYKSMVIVTASLSGVAAVSYVMCNSLFVPLWTHGKITWPITNDLLLGFWMIVLALLHCHSDFIRLTKKIHFMRYIYFLEGIAFVAIAFLSARRGGLPAIIGSSIFCSLCFSGAYGVWRISKYLGYPIKEAGLNWMKPMGKVLAWFLPSALLIWWVGMQLDAAPRLVLNAVICGLLSLFLLLRHGLSHAVQQELLQRAPGKLNSILRRILTGW
jgi:O-antigen/teichoic acid export membrane protein